MNKILRTTIYLSLIVIIGTSAIKSVNNSGTFPTGKTGAAGAYCTQSCHTGGNTVNVGGGNVAVSGLPTSWSANSSYTFSVVITHSASNRKRWGFAVKAVNASGAAIGTFSTTNANATVASGEIGHKNAPSTAATNTYIFTNLTWKAPASNTLADKSIRFFVIANASDGNGQGGGIFYATTVTLPVAVATSITSFTPTKAVNGTNVVIKGVGFTGATAVSFGGTNASSYTISGDTSINAVVGAGSSGSVSVTSPSGTATKAGFTFCPQATTNNINISGCNSVFYKGNTYTNSTTFNDTIMSSAGCDSVYNITNINVQKITPLNNMINLNGCISVMYKNKIYTSSVIIKDTLKSTLGCDSVYNTININIALMVSGNIIHPTKGGIKNVNVLITGSNNISALNSTAYSDTCIAPQSNVTIKMQKNNDVTKSNGVTATDVLFVQRHILGTTKLNNAYKIIAADVDGNKQINATDVLRIKRLILGTDTTFKNTTTNENRLWAFVDSAYQFADTTNPFPFKDSISFINLTTNKTNQTFTGVKLGDVNFDWNPGIAKGIKKESEISNLELGIESLVNHEIVHYTSYILHAESIAALQATLHFDNSKYEFVNLEGFENVQGLSFNATQANETGNIAILWVSKNGEAKEFVKDEELFTLVLRLKGYTNDELGISVNEEMVGSMAIDRNFYERKIALIKRETKKEQPITGNRFSVFPNPAKNIIYLQNDVNMESVTIVDCLGKQVLTKKLNKTNASIDISNVQKGLYMLICRDAKGANQTRKVIVE